MSGVGLACPSQSRVACSSRRVAASLDRPMLDCRPGEWYSCDPIEVLLELGGISPLPPTGICHSLTHPYRPVTVTVTSRLGAAQLEGCRASMAGHLWVTVHPPGAVPAPRHSLQWGGAGSLVNVPRRRRRRCETRRARRTAHRRKSPDLAADIMWLTSSELASDSGYRLVPFDGHAVISTAYALRCSPSSGGWPLSTARRPGQATRIIRV